MLKINDSLSLTIKYVEFQTNKEGIDYIKAKGFITQKALTKTNQKKFNTYEFFSTIKIFGERAYLDEIASRLWENTSDNPTVKINLKEAYISNVVYNKVLRSELLVIQSNFATNKWKFDVKKEHRVFEYMSAPVKYTTEPEPIKPKVIIKKEIVKVIKEKPVKKIIYVPKEVKKQQTWEDVKENIKQKKKKDRQEKKKKLIEIQQESISEKQEVNIEEPIPVIIVEEPKPIEEPQIQTQSGVWYNIKY